MRRNLYGSQYEPARISAVEVSNIDQRVGLINYYITQGVRDAKIRYLASSILSQRCGDQWCIPEKDWIAEISAIFHWVRNNVRYTLDPYNLELFQRPRRAVEFRTADCDDQVILLGSLLQSVGYPIRLVIIDTGTQDGWNHIYLQAGVPPMAPNRWISLDLAATTEPMGWEMPAHLVKRKRIFEIGERL